MDLKLQNIIGWVLLIAGLSVIAWSIYSSFNIFTAKVSAPEIFRIEGDQRAEKISNPVDLQEQMGKIVGEQLKGLLPQNTIPGILNLISWSIFVTFLVFAGAKISGLGLKMLKQ